MPIKKINKIKERKKVGAICDKCQSPDYSYEGRANHGAKNIDGKPIIGKHQFKCNSCGNFWMYGYNNDSHYFKLK